MKGGYRIDVWTEMLSLYIKPWWRRQTRARFLLLSLMLTNDECKGSVLPFHIFTPLMMPHTNLSSSTLPVLRSSVRAKKWDRMCARACMLLCLYTHVVPILHWWFTQLSGREPGPIFSSLHNSKQYHWNCVLSPSSTSSFCFCSPDASWSS